MKAHILLIGFTLMIIGVLINRINPAEYEAAVMNELIIFVVMFIGAMSVGRSLQIIREQAKIKATSQKTLATQSKYCSSCGQLNIADALFCSNCGRGLKD